MSDDHSPTPSVDDLQFSTAEPGISATPASGPSCTVCGQAIVSDFFALGEAVLCPSCCARATAPASGSKLGRVFKSSFLGMAAGLIGAVLWFVIRRVAHMEVGLVAVLVGFMVGKAVRSGSGDRGGRGYQVLAVTITYCCIAINYMPDVLEAFLNHQEEPMGANVQVATDAEKPADLEANPAADEDVDPTATPKTSVGELILAIGLLTVLVFGVSLAAPFLAGAQNLIGLLIIGFALWEAWKFNARRPLPISGPYQLGSPPAPQIAS